MAVMDILRPPRRTRKIASYGFVEPPAAESSKLPRGRGLAAAAAACTVALVVVASHLSPTHTAPLAAEATACDALSYEKLGGATRENTHKLLAYYAKGGRKVLARAPCERHSVYVELARDGAALEDAARAASTPGSPGFRKPWSAAALRRFTAGDARGVRAWLEARGLRTAPARGGAFVRASGPAAAFEAAFGCDLYEWTHAGRTVVRCDGDYAVHGDVDGDVAAVHGLSNLPARLVRPRRAPTPKGASQSADTTPRVLRSYYGVEDAGTNGSGVRQSVFETSGETYSPGDLASFENYFSLPGASVDDVGGHSSDELCSADAGLCSEANLDVQYMTAVAPGARTTYWYVSELELDPFSAYLLELLEAEELSYVNSISWGSFEAEQTTDNVDAFNTLAMMLGLRGATVFVSSGDDGAPNSITDPSQCAYNPSYPATSPHVVAVGATFKSNWEDDAPEVVCESDVEAAVITSGGGFSTLNEAPVYAQEAYGKYLAADTPAPGYAATGRGYPDLSLAGYGYEVVIGGELYSVSGTSCSAPSVAGMLTLVNSIRFEAGAGGAGLLGPTLYGSEGSFAKTDVLSGKNNCLAEDGFCCAQGFNSTTGWDPATGWGSVDYAKFEALLTADLAPEAVAAAKARLRA